MKQLLGVVAVAVGFVIVATAYWLTLALGWRPGHWLVIGIIVAAVAVFLVTLAVLYWRARRSARRALESSGDAQRADERRRALEVAERDEHGRHQADERRRP